MHETPSDLFLDSAPVNAPTKKSGFETGRSIADSSNQEILADANSGKYLGNDPLAARGVRQEENVPGYRPVKHAGSPVKISGEVDPLFGKAGVSIGDRIYHKKRKIEGKVIDVRASGKIDVKLDDGTKGTTSPDNIVRL